MTIITHVMIISEILSHPEIPNLLWKNNYFNTIFEILLNLLHIVSVSSTHIVLLLGKAWNSKHVYLFNERIGRSDSVLY